MANENSKRDQFADLLRELFQLNQPELDFGIYRIMHARKDDINRFIDKDLPRIVGEAFKDFQSQDKVALQAELEKASKAAADAGFDPEQSPKVKELKAQLNGALNLGREEGEVYDALITFFNRYYDEGDFISRRVYKDGTYAIPYNGEEVVLHWANKDQYYIKSSETLRDYSFRLDPNNEQNPMRVHFRLVDAEAGAQNNNKESAESKRVFVLDAAQPWEEIYGEQGKELSLRFHYRAATPADWTASAKKGATAAAAKKPPTQEHLRQIAVERLLGNESDLPVSWKMRLAPPYTKANGEQAEYSILQGQLDKYTKSYTFDYFIHKDLGGFLTRELDFYIKNELLRWEDVSVLKNQPARLAPLLSKIEVIRIIGEKIIAFLAQLEEFQKKLWLKKKFVTEVNYCITLDRLEGYEELLEKIFSNDAQQQQWKELYALNLKKLDKDYKNLSWEDFLAKPEYRYLMADSGLFSEDFKAKLIGLIDGLETQCDGVVIHSENFQALNLLLGRYDSAIPYVFIDPPYNTGGDGFIYKDSYKSASWLSMLNDRLALHKKLSDEDGLSWITLDENEAFNFYQLAKDVFGVNQLHTPIAWQHSIQGKGYSGSITPHHNYLFALSTTANSKIGLLPRREEHNQAYSNPDNDPKGLWRTGDVRNALDRPNLKYRLPTPSGKFIEPPENGWRWSWETMQEKIRTGEVFFSKDETRITRKIYLCDQEGRVPESVWFGKDVGTTRSANQELKSLFGEGIDWGTPKPTTLIAETMHLSGASLVLDYFAGSGSTAHATIALNREDGLGRKYMLVEMGAYFDSVLKPRIHKVVYAKEWKDGTPVKEHEADLKGLSHCFKYVRLESYEDALANLALNRGPAQQSLLESQSEQDQAAREAYLLNYMLDVETRGSDSLLNVRKFVDPTNYKLKVRNPTGDETKWVNVDLLETFNWLLGLTVEYIAAPVHFDAELKQAEYGRWQASVKRLDEGRWWFRTVTGTNRSGQKILIVWRNLPSLIAGEADGLVKDNAVLDAVLIDKLKVRLTESADDEFDILYVNGDHNITIPKKRNGELLEARVKLIEEDFHRLMFSTESH